VREKSIAEFWNCQFLRTDDLGLHSYDSVKRMADMPGRHPMYSAVVPSPGGGQGRAVVLKEYDLTAADDGGRRQHQLTEEVRMLREMRHPNIVEVEQAFQISTTGSGTILMYLQMPRYACNLKQWLQDNANRPPQQVRKLLLDLLRAVDRVQIFKRTHNDIKLENILLTHNVPSHRDCRAALCDFELLREEGPAGQTSGSTTIVGGTPAYMAPERLAPYNQKPTHASDMFSVGVVMLLTYVPEMIQLVEAKRCTPAKALQQKVSKVPAVIMGEIAQMLNPTAAQRPTAGALLSNCTFFSHAENQIPYYWECQHGSETPIRDGVVEVTDRAVLDKIWATVAPSRASEFGLGRDSGHDWLDAGLLDPDQRNIRLVKAWRLQNEAVLHNYNSGLETITGFVSQGPPIDADELPVHNLRKIGIRRQLDQSAESGFLPDGGDKARRDVNEVFLMHGLPKSTLHKVLNEGFNERFASANAGALFGEGTYFAEDIEKADQYTGAPHRAGDAARAAAELADAQENYQRLAGLPRERSPARAEEQMRKEQAWLSATKQLQDAVDGLAYLKAKLYPGRAEEPDDVCYVLVCRVALGYTIRTKGRQWDPVTKRWSRQCKPMDGTSTTRPPQPTEEDMARCMKEPDGTMMLPPQVFVPNASGTDGVFDANTERELVCIPGFSAQGLRYQSLLVETGESILRFREFVLFHGNYVYPEYVVAYKRVGTGAGAGASASAS